MLDICTELVDKGNQCHNPAGDSTGGQFCSASGSDNWVSELSDSERSAVESWVTGGAAMAEVRAHEKGRDNERGRNLFAALSKAPVAEGEVHRGLGGLDDEALAEYENLIKGSTLSLTQISSFTRASSTAEKFALKKTFGNEGFVVLKAKIRGSNIRDLSKANRYGESEVVARAGSKFTVTSVKSVERGDKYGYIVSGVLE